MNIVLRRGIWRYEQSQVGLIYPPGIDPLFVLELPWRSNQKNISCVPLGIYLCIRQCSSKNGKWKEAFFLQNTQPRLDIICGHIANKPKDLLGCMGFGLYHDAIDHISSSTDAIYKWRDAMVGINEFELEIS